MPLVTEKSPEHQPSAENVEPPPVPPDHGDGTRQLLQSGLGTLSAGILAAALAQFAFGGIGPQGPHTNSGWLALIVALMCLPFGFLLSVLGFAKWLRNRAQRTADSSQKNSPK
jgi:putative exporter of polyketide antibiotics